MSDVRCVVEAPTGERFEYLGPPANLGEAGRAWLRLRGDLERRAAEQEELADLRLKAAIYEADLARLGAALRKCRRDRFSMTPDPQP
jgi:hypothetical protein